MGGTAEGNLPPAGPVASVGTHATFGGPIRLGILGVFIVGGIVGVWGVSPLGWQGRPTPAAAAASPGQTAQLFVGAILPSTTVFRYEVGTTGTSTLNLALTQPTFTMPGFLAFSPAGEMFVSNAHTGVITRFLDPQGTPVFHGIIASSEIIPTLHWGSFRGDELFVTTTGGGNVVRFTFDAAGNAVFNGTITAGLDRNVRGVRLNPATGELFVLTAPSPSTSARGASCS